MAYSKASIVHLRAFMEFNEMRVLIGSPCKESYTVLEAPEASITAKAPKYPR